MMNEIKLFQLINVSIIFWFLHFQLSIIKLGASDVREPPPQQTAGCCLTAGPPPAPSCPSWARSSGWR